MRIILVYQHFLVSGVGSTKPYDLAKHLVARGHDVSVICGKGYLSQGVRVPKGLLVRMNIEGIKLAVLGVDYRQQMSFARRILSFMTFTFGAMLLVCFMRRYDVLVASSTPLTVGLVGLVSRYVRGLPWIFEVRDMWPEYAVVAGYLKNKFVIWLSTFFEEWFYRSASAVSTIGGRMRDTLIRRGFPAGKIVFIPTGVAVDEFEAVEPDLAWRAEHGLEGKSVAVYTGAHGPSNGLQYVLEAAEHLKDDPGFRFVLLGHGSDKDRLVAEVKRRGLTNVLLLPPVPKSRIAGILKACEATLLIYEITPATGYDMPNKFFEYLAAGKPMLTNDPAELWDHAREYQCAILTDSHRPQELAEAMRALKADPQRAAQMGRRARELVSTRFDRNSLHQQWEALIERVAARGRRKRPGQPAPMRSAGMHLVYVHQYFSTVRGRMATRSYDFARHLIDRGHRVTVVTGVYSRSDLAGLPLDGVVTRRSLDGIDLRIIDVRHTNKQSFWSRIFSYVAFMVVSSVEVLRIADADVVFATSTPLTTGLPGALAHWVRRVPFVFEVRDIWPETAVEIGIIKNRALIRIAEFAERTFYRAAVGIVAISNRMGERIARRLGPAGRKVAVIPLGTDYSLFAGTEPDAAWRRAKGLEGRFVAVFAGAHGRVNALPWILKAAALLKDDPGIRFVFIGDGAIKGRLVEQTRRDGLENVLWLDPMPRNQVAGVLKACDLGLMTLDNFPIFDTACPNKFMDYLAAGLPVLVNFDGEAGWIARDERCGVIVPPDDPQAMADAVRALAHDPKRCAEMSRRAVALAAERFDRRRLVTQLETLLRSAARSRRVRTTGLSTRRGSVCA